MREKRRKSSISKSLKCESCSMQSKLDEADDLLSCGKWYVVCLNLVSIYFIINVIIIALENYVPYA